MATMANPSEIYYDKGWADRRLEAEHNFDWYSGAAIREKKSQIPDEQTGQPVALYPIALNVIAPELQVHQALSIGSLPDYNTSPAEIRFRSEGEKKGDVENLKRVFRKILRDSNATTMLSEAMLKSQIDGGFVLKINWESYSDFLKYRIRWLCYRPHMIHPIWNNSDPWRLEECYLGWEITSEDAKKYYGIGVKDGKKRVVYMEHWTKTDFTITVDDKVPQNTEYGELSGEHGLGRVPFIYIPHPFRDKTGFWGTSHIDDLKGIQVEINDVKANISDAIADLTHPDMFVTDTRKTGGVKLSHITDDDKHVRPVWDLGDTGSLPGSRTPAIGYVKNNDMPESVMKWPSDLLSDAHWQANLPMAATGREHYSQGRITGVGTQNQLGLILYHTQQERLEVSEGLRHATDITLRMMQAHQSDYKALDIDAPTISDEHLDYESVILWSPQLPMEADKESDMINADVQAGTTSLETALVRKHFPDPMEEKAKIEADMKFQNELQIELAKAQARAKQPPQGA